MRKYMGILLRLGLIAQVDIVAQDPLTQYSAVVVMDHGSSGTTTCSCSVGSAELESGGVCYCGHDIYSHHTYRLCSTGKCKVHEL